MIISMNNFLPFIWNTQARSRTLMMKRDRRRKKRENQSHHRRDLTLSTRSLASVLRTVKVMRTVYIYWYLSISWAVVRIWICLKSIKLSTSRKVICSSHSYPQLKSWRRTRMYIRYMISIVWAIAMNCIWILWRRYLGLWLIKSKGSILINDIWVVIWILIIKW